MSTLKDPGICTKCFSVLKCKRIPGAGIVGVRSNNVLAVDYSVDCGDPLRASEYPGSPEYTAAYSQAIIFIILWVIGIPMYVAFVLFKNRKHLHDTSSPLHDAMVAEYGSLYSRKCG